LFSTIDPATPSSFFSNAPAPTPTSTLSLHDALPISDPTLRPHGFTLRQADLLDLDETARDLVAAGYERVDQVEDRGQFAIRGGLDRKSTRLNSSHVSISYAVFCLKKKKNKVRNRQPA